MEKFEHDALAKEFCEAFDVLQEEVGIIPTLEREETLIAVIQGERVAQYRHRLAQFIREWIIEKNVPVNWLYAKRVRTLVCTNQEELEAMRDTLVRALKGTLDMD
jgi:hypothetical protein